MCLETESFVCCVGSRVGTIVGATVGLVTGVILSTLATENLIDLVKSGNHDEHYGGFLFFYCFAVAVACTYVIISCLVIITVERRVMSIMALWLGTTVLQMTMLVAYTVVHHCSVAALVLTGLAVVGLVFLSFVVYSHCRMIRLGYEPV